jgi:hypothetical protein
MTSQKNLYLFSNSKLGTKDKIYYTTNSMDLSPLEVTSRSDVQDFPNILQNAKFHDHVLNNLPMMPILN